MHKLILGFFSSILMLVFVWFLIGVSRYGEDLDKHHLDLQASFAQLVDADSDKVYKITDIVGIFNDTHEKIETGIKGLDNFLASFITPLMWVVNTLTILVYFTSGVFKFVFFPVFI